MKHIYEEFHDIFYDYKCCNGLIDPNKSNCYSFDKSNNIYIINKDTSSYLLKIIDKRTSFDVYYGRFVTLEEIRNAIITYLKGGVIR